MATILMTILIAVLAALGLAFGLRGRGSGTGRCGATGNHCQACGRPGSE